LPTSNPALCELLFRAAHERGHTAHRSWIARLVQAGLDRFSFGFPWLSTSAERRPAKIRSVMLALCTF